MRTSTTTATAGAPAPGLAPTTATAGARAPGLAPATAIAGAPATVACLALGLGLLLSRLWLPVTGGPAWAVLGVTYLGVAAVGLAGPVSAGSARTPASRALLPAPVVIAIGIGLVVLVAVGSGPALSPGLAPGVLALDVGAAVAEEALFRRLLYGWLLRWGAALAVAGSAVAFALVHVPAYGVGSLWVNLGAGLLFGWQRWASGGWGAPAVTHAAANVVASLG
jgi:membrane protease YdiL (CAAX protease family)